MHRADDVSPPPLPPTTANNHPHTSRVHFSTCRRQIIFTEASNVPPPRVSNVSSSQQTWTLMLIKP
uniref:Bm513 n=1 Tax=Brugia malayi TaxID=6279 RepID=A0A1I9G2X9_BRUMA|nr:Bm513 [Brugia malayi]